MDDDLIEQWRKDATRAFDKLVDSDEEFSSDDVHEAVGYYPDPSHTPNSVNNMIGQLFRKANAQGRIKRVGTVQSKQESRRGAQISVWRKKQKIPRLVRR